VMTQRNPDRADEVMAEVRDSGQGMAEGELSKIFEPFYTTKPPGRGTGLGLSICYGIVQQHRGRISADSVPGQGSTFRVYLPIDPTPLT
jgi:two-component system NtrC family sensor kinase